MSNFPRAVLEHFARSHGIASTTRMGELGLTRHQIRRLIRQGQLVRELHGVYRMPAVPMTELSRCAAVCAAHPTAIIAGPTAGRLWSFRRLPSDLRVHIVVLPQAQPSTAPWIVPHRTLAIDDADRVERDDGVVVMSRLRTAVDMARYDISDEALGSMLEQAMHDGGHSADDLRRVVFPWRAAGRAWPRRVLDLLGDRVPGGAAESHDEYVVGAALAAAGVTGLVRQYVVPIPGVGKSRFDLAVPHLRWAIEVDVFPTHRETAGRRADRQRDAAVSSLGWSTTRVTPADVGNALAATVRRLHAEFQRRQTQLHHTA